MIEPIMYVAIGFLVACMLVIGIIPVVHARAVRLTTRRLEALTPMSLAEIQADKDQLRAEFAMSTRRLEMSVEQMKSKTTSQLAELGKKSEAIGRLKLELSEKTAALFALEAREKQLSDELRETQQQRDEKAAALQEAERLLAEARAELTAVTAIKSDTSTALDNQRVELVTLRAQVEVLKGQIEGYDQETRELHERIARQTSHSETTGQQLAEALAKSKSLATRVSELEREVVAQTTEAEVLGRRVQELLSRLNEQGRRVAERVSASDSLRNDAATANTERATLENELRQSQDERARLQDQIASMKREAEAIRTSERTENAVLRERINDVAAEVARLTSLLEGPGSTIETILAGDAARTVPLSPAANPADQRLGNMPVNGDGARGSLADRIRALQSRAAQVPQAGPA